MVMSQIEWLQGTTSPVLDHLNGLSLATKCLQQKTCGFKQSINKWMVKIDHRKIPWQIILCPFSQKTSVTSNDCNKQ